MSKIIDYPFSTDFASINNLQANGSILSGSASPSGIAGRLDIENGVMKATLHQADALTALGRRAEITAPPDSMGERWYSWQFMIPAEWGAYGKPLSIMQLHDTPDGGDSPHR